MNINFSHIAIEIIKGCNYKCSFCIRNAPLNNAQQLPVNTIDLWLNKLSHNNKLELVSITGGEPFLHKELLSIIQKCNNYADNVVITTNGSIIDYDILSWISQNHKTFFIVSLDSYQANIHNKIRGNKKAFSNVLKFTQACKNLNIPFIVNITISNNNYKDIYKTIKKALELGAEDVSIALVKPEGRGDNCINNEILTSVGFQIKQAQKDFYCSKITFSDPLSHIFSPEDLQHRKNFFCGAGANVLHIQNNGNILLCTSSNESLGNISNLENVNSLKQDFRITSIRKRENFSGTCKTCDFKWTCGGCRCRASKCTSILGEDYLCPIVKVLNEQERLILKSIKNKISYNEITTIKSCQLEKKQDKILNNTLIIEELIFKTQEYLKIAKKIKNNIKNVKEVYIFDTFDTNIIPQSEYVPILLKNKIHYKFSRLAIYKFLKALGAKHIEIIYFDKKLNFLIKGNFEND